jgi:transcriptional regulator with XRE-family HTH domain
MLATYHRVVDSDQRKREFREWLTEVIAHFKGDQGWSKTEIAARGDVPRSTLYRWHDGTMMPTREKLEPFCRALGLDMRRPFEIMGWSLTTERGAKSAAVEPLAERIRKIKAIRYDDPNLADADRIIIDGVLDKLIAQFGQGLRGEADEDRRAG